MMNRNLTAFLVLTLFAAFTAAQSPKLDGHGDPLPSGAIARLGTIRWRADGNIALSAIVDAKTLLTVTDEQLVQIWDAATGKEIRRFDIGGAAPNLPAGIPGRFMRRIADAGSLSISRDGKRIANVGNDGAARVWDVDTGKELMKFGGRGAGRRDFVSSATLSGDGKTLVVTSIENGTRVLKIGEKTEPTQIGEAPQPGAPRMIGPRDADYLSSDGKTLLQMVSDGLGRSRRPRLVIWDTATGKEKKKIDEIPGVQDSPIGMEGMVVSPDLRTAAVKLINGLVLISLADGKKVGQIEAGRLSFLNALVFSPDGKSVISVGAPDEPLTIWEVPSGKVLREFNKQPNGGNPARFFRSRREMHAAVSPDGKTLIWSSGSAFAVRDLGTGKLLNESAMSFTDISETFFAANCIEVFTRGAEPVVRKWDFKTGKQIDQLKAPAQVNEFIISPDGRWFATDAFSRFGRSRSVKILDAISLKEKTSLEIAQNGFDISMTFSPDSKFIALVSRESRTAEVVQASTGQKQAQFKLGNVDSDDYQPLRVRFSPTGRLLVIDSDRLITVWDIGAKRQIGQIPLGEETLNEVVISPDDRTIALETSAGTAIWEIATFLKRLTLHQNATDRRAITFRMFMATGASASNGQRLAFSPDGRLLARAGDDRKIRIFDTWTGRQLVTFEGHRGNLTCVAFSPDGKKLVSGSSDTTALVWDTSPIREQLKPLSSKLDDKDAEDAWHTLNEQDAAKAYSAIRVLAGDPAKSVPFLRDLVEPAAGPDAKKLEKLIADLGNAKFAVREKAYKELDRVGEAAAQALRKAAESDTSAEVRKAAKKLLDNLGTQPLTHDQLRSLRVVEVLERIGTPEAIELLKKLAGGAAGLIPTPQAQATLERLNVKK